MGRIVIIHRIKFVSAYREFITSPHLFEPTPVAFRFNIILNEIHNPIQ